MMALPSYTAFLTTSSAFAPRDRMICRYSLIALVVTLAFGIVCHLPIPFVMGESRFVFVLRGVQDPGDPGGVTRFLCLFCPRVELLFGIRVCVPGNSLFRVKVACLQVVGSGFSPDEIPVRTQLFVVAD